MCEEKGWNVTEANIKEFTLITEFWLCRYEGYALLEAETGDNICIPFSVEIKRVQFDSDRVNWHGYQTTCTLEPQGEYLLEVNFPKKNRKN